MAQVIPNLSGMSSFGSGLGQGIQELATRKLSQINQREEKNRLSKVLQQTKGFSPEESELFLSLPQKDWLAALQTIKPQGQQDQVQAVQPQGNNELSQLQERLKEFSQRSAPEQISSGDIRNSLQGQQAQQLGLQNQNQPGGPLDLSKVSAQDLLQQAAAQGLNFSPEEQKKIAAKFQAIQKDNNLRSNLEKDVMGFMEKQKGQPQQAAANAPAARKFTTFEKPLSEADKIAEKTYQLKAQKAEQEAYKEVKPFLDEQAKDFKNSTEIYKLAKRALDNIEKNKSKWPVISGYLDPQYIRDKDVRDYQRDITNIVNVKSNALRGNPTNFKTKLIEKGKIDLTQPLESQITGLKNIISDAKDVFDTQDIIDNVKTQAGRYPIDISQQIISRIGRPDSAENQIKAGQSVAGVDPKLIPLGKRAINPVTNETFIWNGNDFVPEGEQDGENE